MFICPVCMEELAALAITCVYMDELGPALTPTDVMKPWVGTLKFEYDHNYVFSVMEDLMGALVKHPEGQKFVLKHLPQAEQHLVQLCRTFEEILYPYDEEDNGIQDRQYANVCLNGMSAIFSQFRN